MKEKYYYKVTISVSEYINDAAAPYVLFDTYEEATAYTKPLVKQGYDVVTSIEFCEDDCEIPYIEIPLDTREYIKNLTREQSGMVLKNIYTYFFDGVEPKYKDDIVKDATEKMIARIKEYVNG